MGLPIGKDIAPFPSSQISLGLEPKREELDAMWIDGLGAQALPVSQAVQKGQVAATPFPKHHPSEGSESLPQCCWHFKRIPVHLRVQERGSLSAQQHYQG